MTTRSWKLRAASVISSIIVMARIRHPPFGGYELRGRANRLFRGCRRGGGCEPQGHAPVRAQVDDVICLLPPEELRAIGLWYEDFQQMSDEDVIACIASVK
jgi:hypothetical protein